MELDLLQAFGGFGIGIIVGILAMLLFNKICSGSASAAGVKQNYDAYKNQVEEHFEETSKKFQNMTEQYQDLYQHLSIGATSFCRPDSVAVALVDGSDPAKPAQIETDSAAGDSKASDSETSVEEPSKQGQETVSPMLKGIESPSIEGSQADDKSLDTVSGDSDTQDAVAKV